jgi:hypothetical protein
VRVMKVVRKRTGHWKAGGWLNTARPHTHGRAGKVSEVAHTRVMNNYTGEGNRKQWARDGNPSQSKTPSLSPLLLHRRPGPRPATQQRCRGWWVGPGPCARAVWLSRPPLAGTTHAAHAGARCHRGAPVRIATTGRMTQPAQCKTRGKGQCLARKLPRTSNQTCKARG